LAVSPLFAATINVPADFPTIQAAIDAALRGDTIQIGPGTYHERLSWTGMSLNLVGVEGASQTIVDADGQGRCLHFEGPGAGSAPVPMVIEGLTFRNGVSPRDDFGAGGLYINFGAGWNQPHIVIRDCVIEDCLGLHAGGIYVFNAGGDPNAPQGTLTVTGNQVRRNHSHRNTGYWGVGGIRISGSFASWAVAANTVEANDGDRGGLGVDVGVGTAALDGNTIRANVAGGGGYAGAGGGIAVVSNGRGCVSLTDNLISGNTAGKFGGGVFLERVEATISGNTITGNKVTGVAGGGLYVLKWEKATTICDNLIADNEATNPSGYGGGAGMSIGGADDMPGPVQIRGNTIRGNRSGWGAAAAANIYGSGPIEVTGNTVIGNLTTTEDWRAGSLCLTGGSGAQVSVSGNLIAANDVNGLVLNGCPARVVNNTTVANAFRGIYLEDAGTAGSTIVNCIAWGNGAATDVRVWWGPPYTLVAHCDVQKLPDYLDPTPNLSADPLFDTAAGDYSLLAGSPCIDAGDNSVVAPDAVDLLGMPRIAGGTVDMGCYEFGASWNQPPTAALAAVGTVEANATDGADATLDGSASADPDSDPLTYAWDFDSDGTVDSQGSSATASHFYALGGPYTATLTVTDDDGASDSATAEVTVVDTTPPTITAPAPVEVAETSPSGTAASLGTPTVSDACDDDPTVTNDAPSLFLAGDTVVTWTATDASGNSAAATQTVTVIPGPLQNQLDNLSEAILAGIGDGSIAPDIQGSLMSKVTAALTALAQNRPNDAKIAANNLKAFINEVRAQTDKKIDDATADALIARANQVIVDLGYEAQVIGSGRSALVTGAMALPTAGGAQIVFTLSDTTYVSVDIVNVAGRPVRTIWSRRGLLAGVNTLLWDGRSAAGTKVPSGVYLVQIAAHGPQGSASHAVTTLRLTR
jgi:hypothetical protein